MKMKVMITTTRKTRIWKKVLGREVMMTPVMMRNETNIDGSPAPIATRGGRMLSEFFIELNMSGALQN